MVYSPELITPHPMTPGGCRGDPLVVLGVAQCLQCPPAEKPGGSYSHHIHPGLWVILGMPTALGIWTPWLGSAPIGGLRSQPTYKESGVQSQFPDPSCQALELPCPSPPHTHQALLLLPPGERDQPSSLPEAGLHLSGGRSAASRWIREGR